MEIGSPEWIAALNRTARSVAVAFDGTDDVIVGYAIVDGPEWHLRFTPHGTSAGEGRSPAGQKAHVTFVPNGAVASEIVDGTADLQRAIATGSLRVEGDVRVLSALRATLTALRAAMAEPTGNTAIE